MSSYALTHNGQEIKDVPFITMLWNDRRAALLWLPIRLWLGWQWLESGLGKAGNPAWMQTGEAIKGFWANAVKIPETGRPPIAFAWYRVFLQSLLDAQAYTWFAKLIVFGEIMIGIALILGLFTGIAAFFGGFMNWNFMMAGSASVNPVFLMISIFLIAAWKVSGYIGLDYFLASRLGYLWSKESVPSAPAGALKRAT